MKPVSSGYADVNGIKLYHEIYGEGEPLVLIFGWGNIQSAVIAHVAVSVAAGTSIYVVLEQTAKTNVISFLRSHQEGGLLVRRMLTSFGNSCNCSGN
jgi:hypothetical protein